MTLERLGRYESRVILRSAKRIAALKRCFLWLWRSQHAVDCVRCNRLVMMVQSPARVRGTIWRSISRVRCRPT